MERKLPWFGLTSLADMQSMSNGDLAGKSLEPVELVYRGLET